MRKTKEIYRKKWNKFKISKGNLKLTAKAMLCDNTDFPKVSLRTIEIILIKYGLYGRIAVYRSKLSIPQIRRLLEWWRSYAKAHSRFWKDVIFTDECKIEMHQSRREYVRKPIASRFKSMYTIKLWNLAVKVSWSGEQ